jgi:hypothetical protein
MPKATPPKPGHLCSVERRLVMLIHEIEEKEHRRGEKELSQRI